MLKYNVVGCIWFYLRALSTPSQVITLIQSRDMSIITPSRTIGFRVELSRFRRILQEVQVLLPTCLVLLSVLEHPQIHDLITPFEPHNITTANLYSITIFGGVLHCLVYRKREREKDSILSPLVSSHSPRLPLTNKKRAQPSHSKIIQINGCMLSIQPTNQTVPLYSILSIYVLEFVQISPIASQTDDVKTGLRMGELDKVEFTKE